MRIGIIDTGQMSVGITQVFISKGYELTVIGRNTDSINNFRKKNRS